MQKPELLSPAGNLRALRLACAYGADAVYAGLPRYSLRVRNNAFDQENLALGISEARGLGKKLYVVVNVAPHNSKINSLVEELAPVVELAPDALIVSDPGVLWLLRRRFPAVPLHLSVQANTVNWAAVRFWQELGVQRIILSRELALQEIAEIRDRVPEMELEVFVHGALCMAYSGRCMLSGYFNRRDPNQGACTNACRWSYRVHAAEEDSVGQWAPAQPVLLEDPQRPGDLMPMEEDEHGSYIMNSRDLRALEYVADLVRLGVTSLKIEGRTKSPYYVARTAQVYRRAIDDAVAGQAFDPQLLAELDGLANRGYTAGFLQRHVRADELQTYNAGHSGSQQWVGEFTTDPADDGHVWVEVKNRFAVGDRLLVLSPDGNQPLVLENMYDATGRPIALAPGSGHFVQIPMPVPCDPATSLLVRYR